MKEEKKKEASELGRQKAAQAWCTPETEGTEMDPELAKAFARIIDEIWSLPWLGNATTKELLDEITARIEMDGKLDYRTVDIPVRKDEEWKEHKKRLRRQERIDAQNRRIERFKRKYGHSPFIETEKQ